MPLVAGTVDNHKIPKLAPNMIEVIVLGGVKINKQRESPLKKYIQLKIISSSIKLIKKYNLIQMQSF